MLDRELVLEGLPESKPDEDSTYFIESLTRTKEIFKRKDSLEENHYLLESIDRYLTEATNGTTRVYKPQR